MDFARREVAVDRDTAISYLICEGDAPAVMLLHGLAGSASEFVPTGKALVGRAVVVIDQRGHGHSTRVPSDTSRAAFVNDVVRVIEAENFGAVDLVGQSMGAHTAMLVAATRPDLVRRLVLLEGDEGGGSPEQTLALEAFFWSWPVPFADAWAADLEQRGDGLYPRFEVDVMVATIAAVAHPRWEEWASVTAPTLVVYADNGMFTEAQKSRFVAHRDGVTRVDLADASHDAHLDAFDAWIEVLRWFVSDAISV
jgi:pimeloyl-ACP methyl ester carboxylesterase